MTTTETLPVPPLAIECLRKALDMSKRGESAVALGVVRGVVNTYPEFAPAWNALAGLHITRREALPAAIALSRCIELDPGHAPANVTLGEYAVRSGDLTSARRHFETALMRSEDLSDNRRAWATALLQRCKAS